MNDCIHRWLYICNIHLPPWLGTVFVCVSVQCFSFFFFFFSYFFSFSGKWNSRYSTVYAERTLYVHVLVRILRVGARGGWEGEELGERGGSGRGEKGWGCDVGPHRPLL